MTGLDRKASPRFPTSPPQPPASSPRPFTSAPRKRRSDVSGSHIGRAIALRRMSGFTLIEVMIAFLVIVIGAVAVFNTASESTWKTTLLWERTVAGWVAQNQLAEFRARRSWSNKSTYSGETEMANADWEWRMTVTNTDDPSLRRLDIEVFLKDSEDVKASLTGFMGKL